MGVFVLGIIGKSVNIKLRDVKVSAQVPRHVSDHRGAGDCIVTMAIVPVKVCLNGSCKMITTYAFLDPGSNVSFITENLRHNLGCEGKHLKINLDTMGVNHTLHTSEVKNIVICDLDENHKIYLPVLYSKEKIPVSQQHIPTSADINGYPHLSGIKLPQVDPPAPMAERSNA